MRCKLPTTSPPRQVSFQARAVTRSSPAADKTIEQAAGREGQMLADGLGRLHVGALPVSAQGEEDSRQGPVPVTGQCTADLSACGWLLCLVRLGRMF